MRILLLLVFGAVGTLARYGLQGVVQRWTGAGFPSGTLAVNLLGSFLVGVAGQYSLNHLSVPPEWRIAITIGFLGAFTTFSALGWETVHMLEEGDWARGAVYIGGSLLGGLLAVMLGIRLANAV
ncbi:MAG TPA: fluoride efflux transporter CrcB [Terriglobales bacterium]|nr:fluoride efflux transporter CrcB [Terriglobales bacterium]